VPLWGGGAGPHLIHCGQGEANVHAKFHLDPSNRLATVHQRYRQDTIDRTKDNGPIAYGEQFYKRSPTNGTEALSNVGVGAQTS